MKAFFPCRQLLPLLVLLLLCLSAWAEEVVRLSPAQPYQAELSKPVTHQVDFSVVVTPPYHCQKLKVWLPLPPADDAQIISDSRLTTFPMEVKPTIDTEPTYGNRFAYFEFHEPQGAQMIRHQFTARLHELRWKVNAEQVTKPGEWPESFAPYFKQPELGNREAFDTLVAHLVPRPGKGLGDLKAAMQWIDANVSYDHANASLRADPNRALTTRRGHCSDYHGLCAALGRELGYPTRVTYGLSLVPKNSPSHCKLEAYLPPYGWVSFDLSETQKLVQKVQSAAELSAAQKETLAAAAKARLHAGFRENSWLLLTRGANYELAPKASRAVSVVRTIYAEADGEPLPEPDPANAEKREFAWMTLHRYQADRPFAEPFKDWKTLEK